MELSNIIKVLHRVLIDEGEKVSGLCMDNDAERAALLVALLTEILKEAEKR